MLYEMNKLEGECLVKICRCSFFSFPFFLKFLTTLGRRLSWSPPYWFVPRYALALPERLGRTERHRFTLYSGLEGLDTKMASGEHISRQKNKKSIAND